MRLAKSEPRRSSKLNSKIPRRSDVELFRGAEDQEIPASKKERVDDGNIQLKWEIFLGGILWLDRNVYILCRFFMNRICPHNDGFGMGRTRFGTSAAANAVFRINDRIKDVAFIDKTDCLRGADFYARAAIIVVHVNDTFFF